MQQTKAQRDLIFAEECVTEVEAEDNPEMAKIYGGLCHKFPVLVRTCGLCQAVAFSKSKMGDRGKPRELAHKRILEHVGKLLVKGADPLDAIRTASAMDYIRMTRQVLSAWIYFKRFAVSILKAESAHDAGDDEGGAS